MLRCLGDPNGQDSNQAISSVRAHALEMIDPIARIGQQSRDVLDSRLVRIPFIARRALERRRVRQIRRGDLRICRVPNEPISPEVIPVVDDVVLLREGLLIRHGHEDRLAIRVLAVLHPVPEVVPAFDCFLTRPKRRVPVRPSDDGGFIY